MINILKKIFPGNSSFFRQDKEEYIFYPWRYPGEGFHITQAQKQHQTLLIKVGETLVMLSVAGVIVARAEEVIGLNTALYLYASISMIFSILYIWRMSLFRKSAIIYSAPQETRPKKIVITPWICVFFQIVAIWMAISDSSIPFVASAIIIALSVLYTLYISYFAVMLYRKKGYYFSE